jgi:CheY-like chemotaxis protein
MATLIFADDQDDVREISRRALEVDGHSVLEASNGDEVIRVLPDQKFDLIIMDLVMPKKGGIEALIELRSKNPEMKIMLITGAVDIEQRFFKNLVNQFKVSHVLKKPFTVDQLRSEVTRVLAE